jgi:hypothetical protein
MDTMAYVPAKPRRRRAIWIVPVVVGTLLLAVCGGAGWFAYRTLSAPWPHIDGLGEPSAELDNVLTVNPPAGAVRADAVADDRAVYTVVETAGQLVVSATELDGGRTRWSVPIGLQGTTSGLRLTLLGDLLLIAAAHPSQNVDWTHHVLRVSDGGLAWTDTWKASATRVEGPLVGSHFITATAASGGEPGVVTRTDLATGQPVWTYRLARSPVEVVAPTVWPGTGTPTEWAHPYPRFGGPGADQRLYDTVGLDAGTIVAIDGWTIYVIDGNTGARRVTAQSTERLNTVTAFGGMAFALAERSNAVVAYDLATLAEKWRIPVPGDGNNRLEQCGPALLCVHGYGTKRDKVHVIDTSTGTQRDTLTPGFGLLVPLGGRLLGTDGTNTALVDSVVPWRVTPLTFEGSDAETLAAGGKVALMWINGKSPFPKSEEGYHVVAVDVERRKPIGVVFAGNSFPQIGAVTGNLALVVTHDSRVVAVRF